MHKSRYIIYLLLVGAALCMMGRKPSTYDRAAALRKAEALYGQAAVHEALDSDVYAYRLLDYAVSLAPDDSAMHFDRDRVKLYAIATHGVYDQLIDTLIGQWLSNPTEAYYGKMLGFLTLNLRDYDRAIRVLEGYDAQTSDDWQAIEGLIDAYNHNFIATNDTTNLRKALVLINRAQKTLGNGTEITSQKVRTFALLDDSIAIDSALAQLCRENPDDASAFYYAAEIESRRGNDQKALTLIKKAFDIDPDEEDISLGLALGYRNIGDSVQYYNILGDWLTNTNFDRSTRVETFADFLKNEIDSITDSNMQWVDSITDLMVKESDDARINEIKGIFHTVSRRLDSAITTFKHVNSLAPANYRARMQTMLLQMLNGDSIAALQTCRAALADIPKYPDEELSDTHVSLATYMVDNALRNNDVQRGVFLADSIIGSITDTVPSPGLFNMMLSLASSFSSREQHKEALPIYAKAYALEKQADDEHRYAFYNDYAYSLAIGDTLLDKALDLSRFAVLFDPHNPNSLDTYAWVYFKRGDYAEAQKQINYAIDAAIDARKNTFGYRRDVESGKISKETAEKDDNILFLSDEEKAELRANNMAQAIEYSPDLWETLFEHAGDIAFFNKDIDTAIDYWTRALQINPDNKLLERKVKNRTYFYK